MCVCFHSLKRFKASLSSSISLVMYKKHFFHHSPFLDLWWANITRHSFKYDYFFKSKIDESSQSVSFISVSFRWSNWRVAHCIQYEFISWLFVTNKYFLRGNSFFVCVSIVFDSLNFLILLLVVDRDKLSFVSQYYQVSISSLFAEEMTSPPTYE